jgi:hypothetical protein
MLVVDIRAWSILFVALSVSLAGCGGKSSAQPWETVTHPVFRVKMPGKPTRKVETTKLDDGQMEMTMYVWQRDKYAYFAMASQYPPGTIGRNGVEESLQRGRDGQVNATTGAKLLASKRIDYRGCPALEFSFEGTVTNKAGGRLTVVNYVRLLLVGDASIFVMLSGPPDVVDERRAQEYWNTLEIDAPAASASSSP